MEVGQTVLFMLSIYLCHLLHALQLKLSAIQKQIYDKEISIDFHTFGLNQVLGLMVLHCSLPMLYTKVGYEDRNTPL